MRAISGAQSGADIGGIMGAFAAGLPCTFRTFAGFKPKGRDNLPEMIPVEFLPASGPYVAKLSERTKRNVEDSDATLIFTTKPIEKTKGSLLTFRHCMKVGKPVEVINLGPDGNVDIEALVSFLMRSDPKVLNIAGERLCDEDKVANLVYDILTKDLEG